MYDNTQSQQIRYQATRKVGCQPGDFVYSHFNLLSGFESVYQGFSFQ